MTMKKSLLSCMLACCFLTSGQLAYGDATDPTLSLSVFANAPGVESLLSGDYDHAVTMARKWQRLQAPLASLMTICVARLKTRELDAAQQACREAAQIASRSQGSQVGKSLKQKRAVQAMLESNIGVLRILEGDTIAGQANFRRALELDPNNQSAQHNLKVSQDSSVSLAGNVALKL